MILFRHHPEPLGDWFVDGAAVVALALGAAAFVAGATLLAMLVWTL